MRSIRDILDTYDYDSKTGAVTEKQTGKQITDENELLELKTAFYYKYKIDETERERRAQSGGKFGAVPENVVKRLDEFYQRQFGRGEGNRLSNHTDDFEICGDLATASLRYNLRKIGKDAKNVQRIVSDNSNEFIQKHGTFMTYVSFDVVDYERAKDGKQVDMVEDELKAEQPENTSRSEDVSLKPEEKARRMQFVEDLISTYDAVESQYDYEQRSSSHRLDVSAVVKAIKENSFNGDITQGISGYTDYDEKGKQFTCYTIPELKKITQMLKAAKTMSEKTGKNYLEDFLNQPDVNKLLLEMRQDKNGALRSLRGRAVQNRNANAIPQYPEVTCDDYDEIIGDASDGVMKKSQKMGITQAQAEQLEKEEQEEITRRHERESIANPEDLTISANTSEQSIGENEPVKKAEKFKRGYISEARKKLLDNKKRSLDLQQQTCTYMVMADEEKDKKLQQPTKSIGMRR